MKTGLCLLLLSLMSGISHGQNACNLSSTADPKPFPDLFIKADISYQMEVEYTMINEKETNYYIEYRDIMERLGRVDILEDGQTRKFYYNSDADESFEITATTCKRHNISSVPSFMGAGTYDWNFSGMMGNKSLVILGPSAMFEHALVSYDRNETSVVYMGNSSIDIRGIPAQYWRRCLQEGLTADYYFSAPGHEDVYGIKNFNEIPLRVVMFGVDKDIPEGSKELLPQNYEIMSFSPFLDDPSYTFELPVGLACGRHPQDSDDDIPVYKGTSLFVFAEVVYTDYSTSTGSSYSSNFLYASDIGTGYLSYRYTPWTTGDDGKMEAGEPIFVVFDQNNKYVYETDMGMRNCSITNAGSYTLKYPIPGGDKGYINLADASIFFPYNEFSYLGEGMDRGYKVKIYEAAYPDGYFLGDRAVTNTVVSHYYMMGGHIKRGPVPVEDPLTRIRIRFNGTVDNGEKMNSELNFNMYVFSTQIDHKEYFFDITNCFRNDDDSLLLTIGFSMDDSLLEQITDQALNIEENMRNDITSKTEITPARLPHVLVDFNGGLYVTLYLIERPPPFLDFDQPKDGVTIRKPSESKGITDVGSCATLCLENEDDCWGFAQCGVTCYMGTGETNKGELEAKKECQFYNRTLFNMVPRLHKVRQDLERFVQLEQIKLEVKDKKNVERTVTANTIVVSGGFGDSEELFDLMGLETNPRLRVVKVASKLKSGSGAKVKSFGRLTYGECQSLCLDYKACETVSYCIGKDQCVLSETHAEEIPDTEITSDNYCNLLSRKYADKFVQSPGIVLSEVAKRILNVKSAEECAKTCEKETAFQCLSFDHCRSVGNQVCHLHAVHYVNLKTNETRVTKQAVCGHYSKKFSYDFKRKSNAKTVGSSVVMATNVTVEECSRICMEYGLRTCHGFDFCEDKYRLTASTCSLVTNKDIVLNTAYTDICSHFSRDVPDVPPEIETRNKKPYSNAVAGGVGFLLFVIGCVVGGLIVFGVAYYRVNRSR